LDIAKTLGISEDIIQHARELYTAKQSTSDDLITELETRQAKAAIYLREAEELKVKVEQEHRELQDKLNRLDGEKRQLLETYRTQLAGQFRHVEQRLETAKDVLKRKKQRPSDIRFAGKSLKQARETGHEITEKSISELYQAVTIPWETIAVGDLVTSKTFNLKGEVLERHEKQKEVTIQSGMLKTVVPLADIIRVDAKTGHNKAMLSASGGVTSGKGVKTPMPKGPRVALRQCDIRGLMGDDGLGVLEKFLDDALLDNISTVAVIHGRGTGALKNRIRDALAMMPFVETFYPAEAIDGGDGKTIIELR
jgi:DNA mismatch repair protein MutS2